MRSWRRRPGLESSDGIGDSDRRFAGKSRGSHDGPSFGGPILMADCVVNTRGLDLRARPLRPPFNGNGNGQSGPFPCEETSLGWDVQTGPRRTARNCPRKKKEQTSKTASFQGEAARVVLGTHPIPLGISVFGEFGVSKIPFQCSRHCGF